LRIRAGYTIAYDLPAETAMLLMLSVRPERWNDLESPDVVRTDPAIPVHQYFDGFGNRCSRILAPAGRLTLSSDFIIRGSEDLDPLVAEAVQHPVHDLPDDVVVFLLGSRYCEVEQMTDMAWKLFGGTPLGWARVQAIVDYAHRQISFGYEHARPTRTAVEAHEEGLGVCRDYAHLAVTLCRCMNIPARYCTGYLGDIRVPPSGAAMDFSAWFEVWLGGAWRTFDARHNRRRVGRILMAVGRDATDVAISTSFGPSTLVEFRVVTEELA
jgi:transglutaminase-like putative cysteine protease